MQDKSLLMLLDEVRAKTLRRLEGTSADESAWAPPGTRNTILWHAGHAYVVVETLAMKGLGQPPQIPAGWSETFGAGSDPASVPSDRWPRLETVIHHLQDQRRRLAALLESLDTSDLEKPASAYPDRSVRYCFLHGLHDEACHSGEIYLIRKVWAARARAPQVSADDASIPIWRNPP
jgi:hypothetical protein